MKANNTRIFLATLLCLGLLQFEGNADPIQVKKTNSEPAQNAKTRRPLSPGEKVLVEGSKQAILGTGISAKYFDSHFTLLSVVDKPADRRVMWQFSVNGYEATLTDSIGSYTEGNKQINVHGIAKTLGQTSEIQRTITRPRALRVMKACIGDYSNPFVVFGPVDGQAQLLLVAQARSRSGKSEREREREEERERERKEADKRTAIARGGDVIKSEEEVDERHPPLIIGNVNLQTGKCSKGAGLIAP